MKEAMQIADISGNVITVTFRPDGSPAQAVKIMGGIAGNIAQLTVEFEPAPGQFWGVTDDCHAMTFRKK